MIDYKLKSRVIDSPIFQDYKKWSKSNFDFTYNDNSTITEKQLYSINSIASYHNKNNPIEWKECKRISSAHRHRVSKLKGRISFILLSSDCLFLTLTFNDKVLYNTCPQSRRDYVKKFLNSHDCEYVSNIDLGKKNHREHYHAVVGIDRIDYSQWKHGAINGIKIRNDTDDLTRISKYIAKLTNHAIKETTQRSVIMYSRKKREV